MSGVINRSWAKESKSGPAGGVARSALDEPTTETIAGNGRSVHMSPGYGVPLSTVGALEDQPKDQAHDDTQFSPLSLVTATINDNGAKSPVFSPDQATPSSGFQRLQQVQRKVSNATPVAGRGSEVRVGWRRDGVQSGRPSTVVTKSKVNVEDNKPLVASEIEVDAGVTYTLHRTSRLDRNLKKLKQTLERWINRYLEKDQMAVRDILTEMYDGELLTAFLKRVTGKPISTGPEDLGGANIKSNILRVTTCINFITQTLKLPYNTERWSVEGIVTNDCGSIMSLLVDLAYVLGCPYNLPQNVVLAVVKNEDIRSGQKSKTIVFKVTTEEHFEKLSSIASVDNSLKVDLDDKEDEKDVFDEILASPEKTEEVTVLLLEFVNSQLEMVNLTLESLDSIEPLQIIFLLGILGNFFVPTKLYHLPATDYNAHLENAKVVLMLMRELGISTNRVVPNDIVGKDMRTICRCIYFIFKRYSTNGDM